MKLSSYIPRLPLASRLYAAAPSWVERQIEGIDSERPQNSWIEVIGGESLRFSFCPKRVALREHRIHPARPLLLLRKNVHKFNPLSFELSGNAA
jgi:hypothetical protein